MRDQKEQGFGLVEILMAIAILSVGMASTLSSFVAAQLLLKHSQLRLQGTYIMEQMIDELDNRYNFDDLVAAINPVEPDDSPLPAMMSDITTDAGTFYREVTLTFDPLTDPNLIIIHFKVFWRISAERSTGIVTVKVKTNAV